ncbi:unnamed protein product [Gordionus sp. m RMFG-2023]
MFLPKSPDVCWSDILGDFLETVFHQILYVEQLYSKAAFTKVKNYNIPLYKCFGSEAQDYITNVVEGIKFIIKENALNTINFNIYGYRAYDNSRLLLETFTFDIGHVSNDRLKEQDDFGYELYDMVDSLEQHFRDIILLILSCKSRISNAITIQLNADIGPSTSKDYVQEDVYKINLTDVKSFSITTLIQNLTKKIPIHFKNSNKIKKHTNTTIFAELQKNIEFPWVSADNDIDITHCKKRLLDDTITDKSFEILEDDIDLLKDEEILFTSTPTKFRQTEDTQSEIICQCNDTILIPIKELDTPFINLNIYITKYLYLEFEN